MSQAQASLSEQQGLQGQELPNGSRIFYARSIEEFTQVASAHRKHAAVILERDQRKENPVDFDYYMRAREYLLRHEKSGAFTRDIYNPQCIQDLPLELGCLKNELTRMYNSYVAISRHSLSKLYLLAHVRVAPDWHGHNEALNCPLLGRGTLCAGGKEAPTGGWLYLGEQFSHMTPPPEPTDDPRLLGVYHDG
jgi:hypothetical protein